MKLPTRERLFPHHISQHCVDRGLQQAWVEANGRTVDKHEAARLLGYTYLDSAGILLQGCNEMMQLRPDKPAWDGAPKYISPKKEVMAYDAMLFNHPTIENYWTKENLLKHCVFVKGHPYILLTEGLFKAICCGQNGIACVALAGVTMGQVGKGVDENKPIVPTLKQIIGMDFGLIIAFDADSARNFSVRRAHKALAEKLEEEGARIRTITGLWDEKQGKGLDDYVQKNGWDAFHKIIENSISNETWNNKFPVFKGVEFRHSIEMTIVNSLFNKDWAVIDDVFYQYQLSADGELGFYQKITNSQVKKRIVDKLKQVYELKYVQAKDAEGNPIEKPIPIYRFATQSHKQSAFQFCQSDLYIKPPANEHLIPFLNGTLDTRTGELQNHSRKNYLTWNIPHNYVASSQCPQNFQRFVLQAFGSEYFELVQAIFSMYLDSTAPYGYFVHIMGKSGSGKGTLLRLLASLFNADNVMATGSFDELSQTDKRHQLLTGKRLCYFPDVQGFQGGLTSFYELIDNGMLSGRALHSSDGYVKRWNVRFALASVSHLGIENSGTGWDRRVIPLPTKPRSGAIDTKLFEKLSDEKAQIIAWALSMNRDRRDYLIQNSSNEYAGIRALKLQAAIYSDSMKGFVDQCLEPAAEGYTISTDFIYSAYKTYCQATGLKPTAQNKLISRLAEELPQHHKARTTKRVKGSRPVNIPRHFHSIKFTENIFNHKDGEWNCDRAFLVENNMQLFEQPIQADSSDSGMIQATPPYPESAATTTSKGIQETDSGDSTDSGSKSFLHAEKPEIFNSPSGDSGINKNIKSSGCLNRVNRVNRKAETTIEQASQPIQATDSYPESPLNHSIYPESVSQNSVENNPIHVSEETSYADYNQNVGVNHPESVEHTSVEDNPIHVSLETPHLVGIGDVVMSTKEGSKAFDEKWRGIVTKIGEINNDVVYVDFPERAKLYRCNGGTLTGKPETIITMKRYELKKVG